MATGTVWVVSWAGWDSPSTIEGVFADEAAARLFAEQRERELNPEHATWRTVVDVDAHELR